MHTSGAIHGYYSRDFLVIDAMHEDFTGKEMLGWGADESLSIDVIIILSLYMFVAIQIIYNTFGTTTQQLVIYWEHLELS
jgi:hypothetical protein